MATKWSTLVMNSIYIRTAKLPKSRLMEHNQTRLFIEGGIGFIVGGAMTLGNLNESIFTLALDLYQGFFLDKTVADGVEDLLNSIFGSKDKIHDAAPGMYSQLDPDSYVEHFLKEKGLA